MSKVKCFKVENCISVECSEAEAEFVHIKVPQPELGEFIDHSLRRLPVLASNKSRQNTNCWSWNKNVDKPTFKPSVLVKVDYSEIGKENFCCHSFITDGKVHFLSDCSHEYAGQVQELLEL